MDNRNQVKTLIYKEICKDKPDLSSVYAINREMTTEKLKQITQKEPYAVRK